jgi:hypothetical protein
MSEVRGKIFTKEGERDTSFDILRIDIRSVKGVEVVKGPEWRGRESPRAPKNE